ncbi:homeobox protein NANOG isoform X1 [Stigmatopora argus]
MAEWKTQINYDYNPSYHAFAYGLVYQSGHEQNCHVAGWGEAAAPEFNNCAPGMSQVYYAATAARTRQASPPRSPEQQHVANGHCHYQGSGLVYLGESQTGHLNLAGTPRAAYNTPAEASRRIGSDSTSDSEAHVSPDSWSFSSSRENGLPQIDPSSWVKNKQSNDASSSSPEAVDQVSSSLMGELSSYTDTNSQNADTLSFQVPLPAVKKPSSNEGTLKGKVRVSFSQTQMNTLIQRFSLQRYLTPAEMKNLSELTGLTYKQVKTWFQNRRMKLRTRQKDNNWVSERYTKSRSQASSISGNVPPYQAVTQQQTFKECYNHPKMDVAIKKTALHNLAFYLASMGTTAGSTPFPTWSSGMSQTGMHTRPLAGSVSMPPGINHNEYNSGIFHSTGNSESDTNFDERAAASVINQNSSNTVIAHDMVQ